MLKDYLALIRPRQWTKNAFVLAPMLFAFKFSEPEAWLMVSMALLCFIGLSACVYILNDICDREEDRAHPVKCERPLAAGRLSVLQGCGFGAVLLLGVLALLSQLPPACSVIAAAYLLLQLAYNWRLKHTALLDVIAIASGFVLRVLMGAFAIMVPVSPWIILATFLLACFLGFGKRYHELTVKHYATARKGLLRYNEQLLNQLIAISCASVLICYALYTVEAPSARNQDYLVFTVVFVMIGLSRYLQAIYVDRSSGDPELVLLRDRFFLLNGLCWLVATLALLKP